MNKSTIRENKAANQICGIFGTGRSGSTWLGSILNSHPELAYRFEPFHRLRNNPELKSVLDRVENEGGGLNEEILDLFYNVLIQACPAIDKPPFFRKENGANAGRGLLWPVARKLSIFSDLFAYIYTPHGRPVLVFKEVNLEFLMANMLEQGDVPVVYLIRHPFGVISSLLEGQAKNKMGIGRTRVLASLMKKHDPALADRYTDKLSDLSLSQLNALLWRMDIEKAWKSMIGKEKSLLLFYEDLCINTEERARDVFKHFNIGFVDAVKEHILKSTTSSKPTTTGIKEIIQDSYFSVYRNPSVSMNKWKDNLDKADRSAILEILAGSEIVESYFSYGHWEL